MVAKVLGRIIIMMFIIRYTNVISITIVISIIVDAVIIIVKQIRIIMVKSEDNNTFNIVIMITYSRSH